MPVYKRKRGAGGLLELMTAHFKSNTTATKGNNVSINSGDNNGLENL
jgi:hypothetical protein